MEYTISCPCCNEKLKITISSSGTATAFLLEKNTISREELFKKCGIELGIAESEVKQENGLRKNMFSK